MQGKTYTIDAIAHKRMRNFGESDKYYMKDHHEPIISRETFEAAQNIMANRRGARACGRRLGNKGKAYTFSGKIKCGFCGSTYSRRRMYSKQGDTVIWDCIKNIDSGKESCPESKALRENIIQNSFVDAYNLLCNAKDLNIDELLNNISEAIKGNSNKNQINILKKNLEQIETKEKRLLDLVINETITDSEFKEKKKY